MRARRLIVALTAAALVLVPTLAWPDAPDPKLPFQASAVVHADGSATVTLTGGWQWTTHHSDCNDDKRAVGYAVDWNDDPAQPGNVVGTANGATVDVGAAAANQYNPADNKVYPTPKTKFPAATFGGCGVYDSVAGYNSGTWGPISHRYGPTVTSISVCVVTYDVHLSSNGGSPNSASETVAGGSGHNGDNGVQKNGSTPLGNGCFTQQVPHPNLRVVKSASASAVDAGDSFTYTLAVRNDGNGPANNVVVQDSVPAALTGVAATFDVDPAGAGGTGSCSVDAANKVTCIVGTLAASDGNTIGAEPDTAVVTINVTAPQAACGIVHNVGHIASSNELVADAADNGSNDVAVTVRCPDVKIAKKADAATVSAGNQIGFTITVTNSGAGAAKFVTVSDPLPMTPGTLWSIDGGSAAGSCGVAAGTLNCSIATIGAGSSATVHVSSPTTASSCGTVSNTATVSTGNDGSASAGDSVAVQCPSLHVTKTADDASVSAGDGIGFGISVSNSGPGAAYDVVISDPLPVGSGLLWSVDGGSAALTCAIASDTLTCSVGTLAAGTTATVHVASPTTKQSCGTYSNSAAVSASNAATTGAQASTRVDCAAIGVAKTADKATVKAGDPIGFTITVSNTGAGQARDVVVNDTLPAIQGLGWSIDGGTMAGSCAISITTGTLRCTLPTLNAGASSTVHIFSATGGSTCGPVQNTATASSSNDGTAQATATVIVDCPVGINIVKTGPSLAHVGDTVVYTLTVTNTTLTPLAAVSATDPICNAVPGLLLGDDGDLVLEQGEAWVYTCSHKVTALDPDPMPNTATATGVGNERTVSASDDWVVDIIHPAITITKTANPVSGNPGDSVTFTYVVRNTGDTQLKDVTVDDDKLGFIGTVGSLDAGASKTLTKSITLGAKAQAITNVGTTVGFDVLHKRVTASAKATVTVVLAVKLTPTGVGPAGWQIGLTLLLAGACLLTLERRRRHTK